MNKGNVIQWDELLRRASRELFGRTTRVRTSALITQKDEAQFFKLLFSGARDINPREPEEISRTMVDIYEKLYYNHGQSEDETTVKVANLVENTEGHNYMHTTTNGLEFDFDSNVGLQFGLPQVGVGGGSGRQTAMTKSNPVEMQTVIAKSNRIEMQSQQKEKIKVPPRKKAVVRMTSYKVRYKLDYTMEYKIAKTAQIRVSVDQRFLGLKCLAERVLTARHLLRYLPGFREDEEFVYFTQDGELRWIADRMEVDKEIVPV